MLCRDEAKLQGWSQSDERARLEVVRPRRRRRQALKSPHIAGLFCLYSGSLLTLVWSAQATRVPLVSLSILTGGPASAGLQAVPTSIVSPVLKTSCTTVPTVCVGRVLPQPRNRRNRRNRRRYLPRHLPNGCPRRGRHL